MKSFRRRLWTTLITVAAFLIVLAAVLSSLFRVAVREVPAYRVQIEAWVSQTLAHPVRIGSIRLLWRIFEPVLEINRVELLSAPAGEPMMRVDRMRIGISPLRLLRGERIPDHVAIAGLQLGIHIDHDGKVSMEGMTTEGGSLDLPVLLGDLERFEHIQLGRCRVKLTDDRLGGRPLAFDVAVSFEHNRTGTRILAQLQPPASIAHALTFTADVDGALRRPDSWTVDWSAQIQDVAGWPWLQRYLPDDLKLDFRGAELDLSGRWAVGQPQILRATASAQSIRAVRNGEIVARAEKFWVSARAQPDRDGWWIDLDPIQLTGATGPWPYASAKLRFARNADDYAVEFSGNFLRLDDIAPWLALWPKGPSQLARARGDISSLQFILMPADPDDRGEPAPLFTTTAHVERLGLAPVQDAASIAGVSGDLYMDRNSGHIKLTGAPVTLDLPSTHDGPIALESLRGQINWHRDGDGWHIGAPDLQLRNAGTQMLAQLDLRLPADAAESPRIDLQADFSSDDVTALKPLIPKDWGPHTREWLNRAIQHGHAPHGHLELRGALADYPFVERPEGRWQLDIDLADVTLAFSPAWPAVQHVAAHLAMTGHGLTVTSDSGDLYGVAAEHVTAEITDLRTPELMIDIGTQGEARDYYRVLRESPLQRRLAGLLGSTEAHGPVKLALHLQMPLHGDEQEVHANGSIGFANGSLDVAQLDEPVRDINGEVAFGADGLSADALSGHFHDLALNGRIMLDAESPEGTLVLKFDAPVEPANGAFAAYTPAWLREQLTGIAHWQARLPLSGGDSGHLMLATDLRGVTSRLPPPLQKSADETLPLTVHIGSDASSPLRVLVSTREDLRVALRFAKKGTHLATRGIEARLGPGLVPRADADGIAIDGSPNVFHVFKWLELLGGLASGSGDAPALKTVDLTPATIDLGDFTLPATHLTAKPVPSGWQIDADGDGVRGVFQWAAANGSVVQARLDHLQLLPKPAPPKPAAAPSAPTQITPAQESDEDENQDTRNITDPAKAPLLDIQCDHLRVADAELGRLVLKTSRVTDGQNFDAFRLTGGLLDVDVQGPWRRARGSSTAAFDFKLATPDLAAVLKAFGYAQSLSGKEAQFSGHLAWPDSPPGLQFKTAEGHVKMDVANGTLNAVSPGAGRVLGLMNIYALPRRLTLNFSDVTSKGLGFDKLQGNFALGGGNATTDDLEIHAPSLRMSMRGRIGLSAHDYDERITVYPGVSSGVALGAGLLGGPAGAVIALVAQQLFSKPLDRLAQFSYHVSGSWDNPEFKRGGEAEVAPRPPSAGLPAKHEGNTP